MERKEIYTLIVIGLLAVLAIEGIVSITNNNGNNSQTIEPESDTTLEEMKEIVQQINEKGATISTTAGASNYVPINDTNIASLYGNMILIKAHGNYKEMAIPFNGVSSIRFGPEF